MKLEVKNIVKKFENNLAVNNISFVIEKNKILNVPNQKSTKCLQSSEINALS